MKKKQQKPKKNTARKKIKDQAGNERYQALTRLASIGLIVALLAVIVVLIAAVFFPDVAQLSKPREMIAQVITPIQKTFSTATDGVVGYLRTLKYRSNLEHEYEQLRIRIAELEDKGMLAESYRHQLETYADLDDEMSRNINLQGIRANVIRREPSNYSYTFTIDVGTNQGVADNMAVVFSGALVGYTFETLKDTTQVRGIVDGSARVPTLIESNRDQGWIEGTMAIDGSYACRMYYLDYTTLPRPGDRVITSGVGIEFPKGIPVGFVRESTRQLEDSKQYIVIEPIADFDHLEYVVVYRYRPAYPEEAADRRTQAQASFVPLPSINPVPTFIGQPVPEITAGPDGLIPGIDTIMQSSPEPTRSALPTRDPNATLAPPNLEYNQKVIVLEANETISPFDTPTPSPKPTATFSVQQVTVEDDN